MPSFRKTLSSLLFLTFAAALSAVAQETFAVWQYVQDIPGARANRAFLWLPPKCAHVRGIIYGQQVILENRVLSDPTIRQAAADEGLALLLCSPGIGFGKQDSPGYAQLDATLKALADQSGHPELVHAPLLPIGHSGGAIFAWDVAYADPSRVFAILTVKSVAIQPPDWYRVKPSVAGIPILCVSGQYESWDGKGPAERHVRWLRGEIFAQRGRDPGILISEYVDAGTTHFGWTPQLAGFCAKFIHTVAEARLPHTPPPVDQPVPLTPIPLDSGWLTDYTLNAPTVFSAAPYDQYSGDKLLAFWHLTKDLALEDERIAKSAYGREVQMVTFVQDGTPLRSEWIENVKFEPEADGVTLKLHADFVKNAPPAMPPAGRELGHAAGPIQFRLIGGWCGGGEQVGPDTFRPKPEALSFTKGYNNMMVMAFHPGDDQYSYCEQACTIGFPAKNEQGTPQTISFPPLPATLKAEEGKTIKLEATSDSGLPLQFVVMAGPAVIEKETTLRLKDLPEKATYPIKLRIAAWQWGRSTPPLIQTAPMVEQTISIEK